MNTLHAIFLGLIQGLTEFLPISSSGHFVIIKEFLGIQEADITFSVILHFGTLVAVFAYYWEDVKSLLKEFFALIGQILKGKRPILIDPNRPQRTLLTMVIVGTIPIIIIGLIFEDPIKHLFENINFVGYTLIITGGLLWLSNHLLGGRKHIRDMRIKDAMIVGIFQGVAIMPGVSRSGSTIFAGLLRGLNRELATRFSFLLMMPAVLGATVLEAKDLIQGGLHIPNAMPTAIGFVVSAVSGYFAIRFLIRLLSKQKLHYFSFYCWGIGTVVITYSLFFR